MPLDIAGLAVYGSTLALAQRGIIPTPAAIGALLLGWGWLYARLASTCGTPKEPRLLYCPSYARPWRLLAVNLVLIGGTLLLFRRSVLFAAICVAVLLHTNLVVWLRDREVRASLFNYWDWKPEFRTVLWGYVAEAEHPALFWLYVHGIAAVMAGWLAFSVVAVQRPGW